MSAPGPPADEQHHPSHPQPGHRRGPTPLSQGAARPDAREQVPALPVDVTERVVEAGAQEQGRPVTAHHLEQHPQGDRHDAHRASDQQRLRPSWLARQ